MEKGKRDFEGLDAYKLPLKVLKTTFILVPNRDIAP